MRFVNEYEMTRERFVKWSTSKLSRQPIFYVLMGMLAISIFAWIYFAQHDAPQRWETLAAFIALISLYRGVFYGPMAASKSYKLTIEHTYHNEPWMCKIEVAEGGIRVSANGKMHSYIKWERVSSFQEAKSFFDIKVDGDTNQARLDKESFTLGDAESFKEWMLKEHPEVPYREVDPAWNK